MKRVNKEIGVPDHESAVLKVIAGSIRAPFIFAPPREGMTNSAFKLVMPSKKRNSIVRVSARETE